MGDHPHSHHQFLLHHHQNQQPHQPPARRPPQSRLGAPRGGGEIVEVQGGHIVRSTGRKDRHSKVCTAKGPRDRRVRLSAHTAIQFYDVQDRLGYDRPSKAVDWLMKNAKAAIDELAELPAWHPTATTAPSASNQPPPSHDEVEPGGDSGKRPMLLAEPVSNAGYGFGGGGTSFLPPSLDSDAIADTIKSFFPIAAAAATTSTVPSSIPQPISYHNFPPDLLSRTSSQDLRLSLQSFQDPIFQQPQSTAAPTHHSFFSGSAPMAFDVTPSTWPDQNQRMIQWNVADGGGGGYVFNVPPPQPPPAMPLHPMLGHSQFFTQRGPLQSSNSPSVRAWAADPMPVDHPMHPAFHPSISSIGFASGDGFSGFRIPARIQGEEEHDDDKPSASHH